MQIQIATVAKDLFSELGIEGVTMRRIAKKLGVTPTTIYRHFANKDEVIDLIVDEGFSILERNLKTALKGASELDAIMKLLHCYLDLAIENPRHFDLMLLISRSSANQFPDDFRSRKSVAFNLLLDIVSGMIEHGKLKRDDALETSLTIWAQAHGLVTLYRSGRFGNDPVRIRAILDRSIRRLFEGLIE